MSQDNYYSNPESFAEGDVNFTLARSHWERALDAKTKELLFRDSNCFMHQALSTPCLDVIKSSNGSYLESVSGKKYLDFHGNSVHQIGFAHPLLVERLKEQISILPFSTRRYTNEVVIQFAEKLISLMPSGINKVLLTPNGSSAIGIALKIARAVTGRKKVMSYWDSFHGASLDVAAVSGETIFQKHMGLSDAGVLRIPPPSYYRGLFCDNEDKALEYLEYVFSKEPEIGAFLAETIRNTDVQIPSLKYWQSLRELCDRYGVVLILDEIPIALGRTGKMFAFEHFGIEPDILCLGKGLGGGIIPQAAVICRESYNRFSDISLGHYTHEKSPLGAAAGLTVIDIIEKEDLLAKARILELEIRSIFNVFQKEFSLIGDVRGIGLLWGIELVKDRNTKDEAFKEAEKIMYDCLKEGLNFKVSKGNVLQLCPPLTISNMELADSFKILHNAFSNLKNQ